MPKTDGSPEAAKLMGAISYAWNRFGCAICGHIPGESAPSGFRIELHHIVPRAPGASVERYGRDDSFENLMGLCGELTPNRCHWRVTNNKIKIAYEDAVRGYTWTDTATGESDICRFVDGELLRESGLVDGIMEIVEAQEPAMDVGGLETWAAAVERIPAPHELPEEAQVMARGLEGAKERFVIAQGLWQRAQKDLLTICLIIQQAIANRDWWQLEFDTMEQWADAIGISAPMISKMRSVSRVFGTSWMQLPDVDRAELTVDRLYYAARLVETGYYPEPKEALHEAVAQPQRYIYAEWHHRRKELVKTHQGQPTHECPVCGQVHVIRDAIAATPSEVLRNMEGPAESLVTPPEPAIRAQDEGLPDQWVRRQAFAGKRPGGA